MEKPILEYPDFEKEFILITNASGIGLGAILAQKNKDNKEVVIAYASRSLVGVEKNYPITELECLAVVWAIEYFHKFLVGRKFIVITDHAPLKSLMKGKVPKGRRARWMMELQQYNFEIVHRSGKENKNADALSRLRFEENINKESKPQDGEITTMERRNEQKLKYVKIDDKWYDGRKIKKRWDEINYFTDKEAMLLNLDEKTEEILLKRLNREKKPQLIIIDGVDGVGKSTVVENLMKQLEEKDGLKITFNKFKRRRNDDKRFEKPTKKYEWLFRRYYLTQCSLVAYLSTVMCILC
jgi:hypothetical protein